MAVCIFVCYGLGGPRSKGGWSAVHKTRWTTLSTPSELANFVEYCDQNYLELNVSKTKEMVIDFRRKWYHSPDPIIIKGSEVERVSLYKYLGIMIDDQLSWSEEVDLVVKKLKPRLYCLRKMSTFGVRQEILTLFYQSTICGVWRYCLICWGGNADKTDLR